MPRFADLLSKGMEERGHSVTIWSPKAFFYRLPSPKSFKKWLGYIDQFVIFPMRVKKRLKKLNSKTLFVFTDQALGPWVPLVSKRPHVIHCHDFLAQFSALDQIPENKISWSGKMYQKLIRRGYRKGSNFISVSEKTRSDLHLFVDKGPNLSEVVYNGLNRSFAPDDSKWASSKLSEMFRIDLSKGYILHVGGNQFYKNRKGVLEIYDAWRSKYKTAIPLLMVGPEPPVQLEQCRVVSDYSKDIHFLTSVADDSLLKLYQRASVLLFPSLAEGFGWPIAEAMACGCPVITTNEAPLTEVGGKAASYIGKRPVSDTDLSLWKNSSAQVLQRVITLPAEERNEIIALGLENIKRFDTNRALNRIEGIYKRLIDNKGA